MQPRRDAFVDQLCERLAVERGGVEIYGRVLAKIGDPALEKRLARFRAHEAAHRDLLASYLDRMGVAEAERQTPSARLAEHEGQAFLKLVDEADTPAQLLNILLTVELMDETAWELLMDLARDGRDEETVRTFSLALRQEKEHLREVRGIVAQLARDALQGDYAEP